MRFFVYILLLLILLFSGCTFDTYSDPQDELLGALEQENENLRNEIIRISNLVEELQESKEKLINKNTTIEFDDLELEYLLFRNSCQNMIQRANNKLNRNIFEDYFEVSDKIDSIDKACEDLYKTNFRNLEIYDNSIYSNYNDVVRRLENREDDLRRINSDNCIDDVEDLKFELRDLIEFDSNFDLAFYVKEFEEIKEFCGSRVSINEDEYDKLVESIEELINSQRDTTNGEGTDIDSIIEQIKKELEEERLQREEERRLNELQGEYDEYFNRCNNLLDDINTNFPIDNLIINDLRWIIPTLNSSCISSYNQNFTNLNNYENIFQTANETYTQLIIIENEMIEDLTNYCIPEIELLIDQVEEVEAINQYRNLQNRYSGLLNLYNCRELRLTRKENNWNNLTVKFNQKLNDILSSSQFRNDISLEINKQIIGVSNEDSSDSNVIWNASSIVFNSNTTYNLVIQNLSLWVSNNTGDPDSIDFDPLSNELLFTQIDEVTISPDSYFTLDFIFNYTDLPSPITYSNFESFNFIE